MTHFTDTPAPILITAEQLASLRDLVVMLRREEQHADITAQALARNPDAKLQVNHHAGKRDAYHHAARLLAALVGD